MKNKENMVCDIPFCKCGLEPSEYRKNVEIKFDSSNEMKRVKFEASSRKFIGTIFLTFSGLSLFSAIMSKTDIFLWFCFLMFQVVGQKIIWES